MARMRKQDTVADLSAKRLAYEEAASATKPKPPYLLNAVKAFAIGGALCMIGQAILAIFGNVEKTQLEAIATTQAAMILLGAILTDAGVYDNLGNFAGMGAAVPITGFSNTIIAAAIDFRREGWIAGMASKMFIIAGPVLVYGILAGVAVGVVRMLYDGVVR